MLADEAGDIASVEMASTKFAVRRPADDEDAIFHTNYYHTPEMHDVEVDRQAVFVNKAPRSLMGKRVLASAEVRYDRFGEMLSQKRAFDSDDLAGLMADHADGEPGDSTLCVHSSYWYTTATMQFRPRDRCVRIAYDTACRAKHVELAV